MNPVVVDASALAAIVFQESEHDAVTEQLDGATVFAPQLLKFELANVAWKKIRRQPSEAVGILTSLTFGLEERWGIVWQDINATDVVLLARAAGLSVYDASYVWLAGSLGADIVTLDRRLVSATAALFA